MSRPDSETNKSDNNHYPHYKFNDDSRPNGRIQDLAMIQKLTNDLKFTLKLVNWDDMTADDLERIQQLYRDHNLMDEDGNFL